MWCPVHPAVLKSAVVLPFSGQLFADRRTGGNVIVAPKATLAAKLKARERERERKRKKDKNRERRERERERERDGERRERKRGRK